MRVLHADDQPLLRRGVANMLGETFTGAELHEASSAREALFRFSCTHWDLVILEAHLPDRSGLEVLSELHVLQPRVPVVILTAQDPRLYALRAIAAGASAYLTKDQPVTEVVLAARAVLAGSRYITPVVANLLADRLNADAAGASGPEQLTQRELDVLRLLGEGHALKEVAGSLCISPKTVSTYRSRILEKLGLQSNADLVRYAVDTGLVD